MLFFLIHGCRQVGTRFFSKALLGLSALVVLSCSEHYQQQLATDEAKKQDCVVQGGEHCPQTKVVLDPFRLVIAGGDENFTKLKEMIEGGFDVNAQQDETGMTLLMYAVKKTRIQFVAYLLSLPQIDKSIVDSEGRDVLWYAEKTENQKLINDILGETTSIEELNASLVEKIKEGALKDVISLIESGAEVEVRFDREGKVLTPLLYAILLKKKDIVSLLIKDHNADLMATFSEDGNDTGTNALMMALDSQNPEIIDMILAKKPDISAKDAEGKTALFYVSHLKDIKIAKPITDTLLARGASLVAAKNDGIHLLTYVFVDQSNVDLGDYMYDICLTKHTQPECDEE